MKKIAAPFLVGLLFTAPLAPLPLFAATLSNNSGPAELPPAGFIGDQFVDSRGCIYIRAGRDGAIQWIPRVTRDRKLVCGFAPSFPTSSTQVVTVKPSTTTVKPKVTTTTRSVPAKAAPLKTVASTVATRPVVTTPVRTPVTVKPVATKPVVRQQTAASAVTRAQVVRPAQPTVTVPDGYRPAWKDDRMNTKRAIQTAKGIKATDLIWTRTVPRKLIHRPSGEDVTKNFGKLIYPFTDINQQQTYLAASDKLDIVARPDGAIFLVPKQATATVTRNMQKSSSNMRHASTSSKTSKRTTSRAASDAKYVQVGTFGVSSNATKTVSRLKRLGLPVRTQKVTRSGKSYTVVMAGPFSSRSALNSALSSARTAGFSDAFAR